MSEQYDEAGRRFAPGDVAMVLNRHGVWSRAILAVRPGGMVWEFGVSDVRAPAYAQSRPLVVIDPEDREQVERLVQGVLDEARGYRIDRAILDVGLSKTLREFANPTPPKPEPADPAARVTDRRDNIWRLLADGDWVCTSGPDVGEYLTWDRLASERGPVEVESC